MKKSDLLLQYGPIQSIFEKVDEFGWWEMERTQTDAGMNFTSN